MAILFGADPGVRDQAVSKTCVVRRRRGYRRLIARPLLSIATSALICLSLGIGADQTLGHSRAIVDHVADGDTIQVGIHGHQEDVRLIGIDTPEVYFGTECGGPEASASMKRMLKPGDRVRLIRDRSQANRDRYGRLLRYVELAGRDLGRKQLRQGWASVYVFDDPFNRVSSYRRAAKRARRAERGVWGLCGDFQGG